MKQRKPPKSDRLNVKRKNQQKENSMKLVYTAVDSPVGKLKLVASDNGLVAILWEKEKPNRVRLGEMVEEPRHSVLVESVRQLKQYFAGKRNEFDIPLDMRGTEFQRNVWGALLAIPLGETRTYAQIAKQLGNPTATRAVGAAIGRNPLSIIAPCHRVLGSSGKLTGFAGGLETKARLLEHESKGTRASAA